MYHSLIIHLTIGHLSHFQVLAIMSKTAINLCVQVYVGMYVSTSFEYIWGVQLLDCMVRMHLGL